MNTPSFLLRLGLLVSVLAAATPGRGQYYYKDIVITAQSQEKLKTLKGNRVRKITLQSLETGGEPTPGFICTQSCATDYKTLTTYTTTSSIAPSTLIASYDQSGRLIKTSDSSERYVSTTTYNYDASGQVIAIKNISLETDNKIQNSEDHYWNFENGSAVSMKKIKNGLDTTIVTFKNEAGNVTEELAMHAGGKLPAVFYYYDSLHQLTDIVRYSAKAQRLLPDYMFSYEHGLLQSMLFVPTGSGDYENWQYEYDEKKLLRSGICRNKRRETIGMIHYAYSFQ